MSKYIVKNCPSCTKQDECIAMYLRTSVECKYRNDCVLKQVVELYKEQTQFCKDCSTLTCEDCNFSTNGFAEEVIELLDIQEVE